MATCEVCKKETTAVFGSGRFCNRSCANTFSSLVKRVERNEKISNALKQLGLKREKPIFKFICEKCGSDYVAAKKPRKGYKTHCTTCKRTSRSPRNSWIELNSLAEVSRRTAQKILKRANVGCCLCGWDETTCDIHHILPKGKGGTNDMDNLIIVCPNCHRKAHENKLNKEQLFERNLKTMFPNWKKFYYAADGQVVV